MKSKNTDITAVGLHIGLGLVTYFFKPFAKVYFVTLLIVFGYRIIMASNNQRVFEILKACAYFVGAEVFFRMTKGSISYEASKYLVIVFSLVGMVYKGISGKGYPYFVYILCMIPSIFVASTTLRFDAHFRTNIAFVLSGPVCLGVASLFTFDKRLSLNQFGEILWVMLLPLLTMTSYLFFYNPSIEEVLSSTASNYATSGGFGPNQVATVLGLGMFISAVRFFMYSPTLQTKIFHLLIFGLISYRALVTFSRGGVIAAVITIAAFLYFFYQAVNLRKKGELLFLVAIFFGGVFLTWTISTIETRGYIELRYGNKDALGREKGDITTGRTELFLEEIEGFIESPFFGIGSSRAKDQRKEEEGQGVVSHNEVSRTLAEHGIFGIAMLGILILMPLYYRSSNKRNLFFFSFLAFWFATINHSGMRIAAPAFVYALALLNVTYEKRPLRRQQPEAIKK
ncbi:O-antigen ligase family protein [Mangrovimonas sp. AS39]|uniref:O-antigen ligase family protein n=1 Tax=Mangrovimonas futianensis TaxID=2895523 RepID=UPI001E40092E|nr:O-antigen ligase family protein [Mangrovimonas futianensis]MCF1191213.1 O-antigen ligase family protein [Mangrovimonas futianensis]MCF1194908.1 O-antigen ligase family protein [Mangrovimonas futianensis]